jgi:histone-lysine N-methyltransferase SUV420H
MHHPLLMTQSLCIRHWRSDPLLVRHRRHDSCCSTQPSYHLRLGIELDRSGSELSELSESEELDDTLMTITRRPSRLKKIARKAKVVLSVEPEIPTVRYQGDYFRTPLLLGEAYSRWVDCKTCDSCWVQPNGYYTRKECLRCERHSKLYGYRWPKRTRSKGMRKKGCWTIVPSIASQSLRRKP